MSRMLQALRQIEASAGRSPQPAVSTAANRVVGVESPPAETSVAESAEQVFDQVESALAAENLCPLDAAAAWQVEPLPALDSPALEQAIAAEGATGVASVLGEFGASPVSEGGTGVSPVFGEFGVSPVSSADLGQDAVLAAPASRPRRRLARLDSRFLCRTGRLDCRAMGGAGGRERRDQRRHRDRRKNGKRPRGVVVHQSGRRRGQEHDAGRLAPELQRRVSGEVLVVDGSLRAAAPAARPNIHLTGRPLEALAGLRKRCRLVLVDAPSLRFSETAPWRPVATGRISLCGWGRRRGGPWRKRLP